MVGMLGNNPQSLGKEGETETEEEENGLMEGGRLRMKRSEGGREGREGREGGRKGGQQSRER